MNKSNHPTLMACCRLLLAGLMVLGFAACTDDTTDNPADGTEVTEEEVENITDDQMAVMVTADLPTAVLRPFDEGSSRANGGSALVARLWTSSGFNGNTGIYLVNSTSAPRFSWYNWSDYCWVRPAFAF